MKVGFIGLGIMGSRMAANLLKAGIELTVYNRSKNKAEALLNQGANWTESLEELAVNNELVYTMLSKPEVVEELAFGPQGFAKHMKTHQTWIDSTTINPSFAKKMAQQCADANIHYLEAPVAGTKGPAEKGELVFFVGGGQSLIAKHQALFDIMGKKTIHAGPAGNGAAIKMTVNLMLGANMLAFTEAISLGTQLGIAENILHQVLLNAPVSAGFLSAIQEKLKTKDLTANFPLQWMQKDLGLATATAQELGISLPATAAGQQAFAQAVDAGWGEHDFSAIYHFLNQEEKVS